MRDERQQTQCGNYCKETNNVIAGLKSETIKNRIHTGKRTIILMTGFVVKEHENDIDLRVTDMTTQHGHPIYESLYILHNSTDEQQRCSEIGVKEMLLPSKYLDIPALRVNQIQGTKKYMLEQRDFLVKF